MIKDIIQNVYSKRPLVHNITNYVAATDCANITLTIGASPIMADEPKEVGEVTQIADGLVLNCGTISESRLNAMLISGKTAKSREIPIVLDPVGVGISKFRTSAVHKIITEVKPDIVADFTNLPFEDNSFYMVVFDPPHLKTLGETSWMAKKYGKLPSNWQEVIKAGFDECMRVLKPNGTLIFKWNESEIKAIEILSLIPYEPLFGHTTGRQSKTIWMCFMKLPID